MLQRCVHVFESCALLTYNIPSTATYCQIDMYMCNDVQQYLTLSYIVQHQYNQVMMLRHCYMDVHHVTTLLHCCAKQLECCTYTNGDVC